MKQAFKEFSPFQVNPDKVWADYNISASDFEPATEAEKESMVEVRKSVSYWRDAARRFKNNTVSMVALGIFIIVLLFAFLGPSLIPYDYANQYRSSQKLGPFEYSDQEAKIKSIEDKVDCMFATALQPGSSTGLDAGDYYFKFKGNTYCFNLDKKLSDSVIILKDGELSTVREVHIMNGEIKRSTPLSFTSEVADGAKELTIAKKVFPHMVGTDSQGRDLLARTMYGARVSIIIGIVAALIVLVIGSIYGAISGLCGGVVDFVMMRIVELIYSVPEILLVLLLQVVLKDPLQKWFDASNSWFANALSTLGAGIVSIFITFALLYWVTMSRIVRGQVLMLKKQEYVTAATALGASNGRIIRRHLLPNCVGQLVITTCLQIPSAIFLESFLSFLGLGVSAPMASLGSLCSDALGTITIFPYRLLFPGAILTIIVLTLNLVGDGLRDALDPRLKK
ncbi:MAG: ABC transporter permease [Mogibacterium sp.]|nr:ABC transporter permease [Mogibacterium sp.]MBQ6501073.1 ABC transporter permease [Mogibacterium sp.]